MSLPQIHDQIIENNPQFGESSFTAGTIFFSIPPTDTERSVEEHSGMWKSSVVKI